MASGRGNNANGRGNNKVGAVTDDELATLEYELRRDRIVAENEKKLALIRQKGAAFREMCETSQPPKQKRRKV